MICQETRLTLSFLDEFLIYLFRAWTGLGQRLKVKVKVKSLSRVRLFATPWTVAYQALLSMGFSRQEYWSGLLFPSLGTEVRES